MRDRPPLARLWAPWRQEYLDAEAARTAKRSAGAKRGRVPAGGAAVKARAAAAPAAAEDACLFCRVRARRDDRADLVLARRRHALLMLNRYPYNSGHLMVAVLAHKAHFGDLTPAERRDVVDLIAAAERALAAEYHPDGLNYGANVGRVAGAGFPGHLHVHLVPRWDGDTNFMPVIGATKVLPESLERTWTRLRRRLARATRGAR